MSQSLSLLTPTASMLQSVQEFTDITALIKGILNGYPGNSAIFREYLQNSDDAHATSQLFILDERCYPTKSLVDPALQETQGPALIAVNDGLLRDVDWIALTKINSSSKGYDETQTGKNGLGFRASYHLTENPHVLCGRRLMILDAHHAFEVYKGGISIDPIGQDYEDQLAPFKFLLDNVEGSFQSFNGTAFRLPLRTEEQARRSQIKDTATSVQDMRDALLSFAKNDLEQSILFLKHITSIHIRHINASGIEEAAISISTEALPSSLSGSYTRNISIIHDGTVETRTWLITHHAESRDTAERVLSDRLGYEVGDNLIKDKLVASVELAIPKDGSPIRGRLFTLLPLPQLTDFPVHLNSVFALTTDRQSLKNILEVGQPKSRERRLVEWNRTIFDTWTPEAWADMLAHMPSEVLSSASWSLWPPEEHGENCYWAGLCRALVNLVVSKGLAVFPTHPYEMQSHLVAVHDSNVLVAPSNPEVSLETLCELGIHVIQPPPHIYAILSTHAKLSSCLLSAQSLHRMLCQLPREAINCDRVQLLAVMDYLVFSHSPPALQYIAGLPWFNCASGYPASIEQPVAGPRYFVPSSNEEARLFSSLPNMLAWNSFSEELRKQLSMPSAMWALNVSVLTTADLFSNLSEKFKFSNSVSDEVPGFTIEWVLDFWSWAVVWSKQREFFAGINAISDLYLLPTAKGNLRKLSAGVISFADSDTSVVDAWNALGVSPLHPKIPEKVVSYLRQVPCVYFPRSSGYIVCLIRCCDISQYSLIDEKFLDAFRTVRTSFCDDLPRNTIVILTDQDKQKLSSFPIFQVRTHVGSASVLKAVPGHRIYVDINDSFPLPHLQSSEIYVDSRDFITRRMASLLDPQNMRIHKSVDLLRLAANNWQLQPTTSQDLFADYALNNWRKLPPALQSDIEHLPFVTVNDQSARQPPRNLIHPDSILKRLYIGEVGRMPVDRFSQRDYLIIMQNQGFLLAELNDFIIKDRLEYLSKTKHADDPRLRNKAIAFLRILDRYWKDEYASLIAPYHDCQWIPSSTVQERLIAPSQCRDGHCGLHSNPHYYDLVWDILEGDLFSSNLRSALGWSHAVPPTVLVDQYQHTLNLSNSPSRNERIVELLKYLDQLWHNSQFQRDAVETLRAVVANRPWVPVISDSSDQTVNAKYALLSECGLRPPFRLVDRRLNDNQILSQLGCTSRPAFEVLKDELLCQLSSGSSSKLDTALTILEELAGYHDCAGNREAIQIPGEDSQPYSLDLVYFRDMAYAPLSTPVSSMAAAHKIISKKLAEALGIQMLSSISLGDIDADEEQMSEDLVSRIGGFLRDYDPQYAVNEFLANADDAGANQFHMCLADNDRRTETQEKVISPQFQSLLRTPSFFLFNNALLSEEDFTGLRRVGQGGKLELSDTHGRHGLGALSLYYFTDVVTVISGEFIMILDPSGKYLPPLMNGSKRTALKRPIRDIISQYPDQFKACEPLGVSATTLMFHGTLFFLPLHSTISKKTCGYSATRDFILGGYRDLAQRAFFFTQMKRISATEITAGRSYRLWVTSAKRSSVHALGENFSLFTLQVKPDDALKNEEVWFVTTSETTEIPNEHEVTAVELKLQPQSKMKVQLAINPEYFGDKPLETYPFSTMALPRSISLPFHLNARFAISSNRQGLVLNSADSQNKYDRKTSFNTWILAVIIPPLYLASLEYLVHVGDSFKDKFTDHRWWLLKCSDETSKITRSGIFSALAIADSRIFRSADRQWISFRDSVFSKEEPREVKKILNTARTPNFVPIPRRMDISALPSAKIVDPEFVNKALLRDHTILATLQQQLFSGDICDEDIFKTLHYIRQVPPMGGLPLLLLSKGDLVEIPKAGHAQVFISGDLSHFSLFSLSNFVQVGYSPESLECLGKDSHVNVVKLTDERVPALIERELNLREGGRKVEWVRAFWMSYHSLPGPPSLTYLEKLPLVEASCGLMPLSECLPNRFIYKSARLKLSWPWIKPILRQMGIEMVNGSNTVVREFLSERFRDPIDNILQCFANKGVSIFSNLEREQHTRLAQWIRSELSSLYTARWRENVSISKGFLSSLPIWDVHVNGATRFASVSELEILPSRISIEHIRPFLKANISIAEGSDTLTKFAKFCSNLDARDPSPSMSCHRVWSSIIVPTRVTETTEVQQWRSFIRDILGFLDSDLQTISLMIPNRDGYLRPVGEFYDGSVDLFARSLMLSERSPYVHTEFRNLVPSLRKHGLVYEITLNTFRVCVAAIQEAIPIATSDPARLQILREMSTTAFQVYQSRLPSQIMTNASDWASLDHIAFILPNRERRQGASYDVNQYFSQPLPLLITPSLFVRPELEPIAWTQRALFFSPPSEQLLAVNKKLGVPEVHEVVNHLKVLSTKIAVDHPGDWTLLSDLKATYKWLNDRYEEARQYLPKFENEKLFLNVADPENEPWAGNWVVAKDLVIQLEFDTGSKKYLRNFLKSYENLLLAAGCSSLALGVEPGVEQYLRATRTRNLKSTAKSGARSSR
ncbi:hypothetical protein CPB84DRAFT_758744 [Gymnopilus junonius]|uniref:Sacsin/Nov domain-containing protein n=1 Tax=Gymnopilus junonius TaxID=109634 RepID=A0A9P5NX36_GYMJU|nr:hypothetical protein CPB84DRAFT_758744 [Gymnopilus junonius]